MEAVSFFQGICPVIKSNKTGEIRKEGKLLYTYNYADLAHILQVTQDSRAKAALAVVWSSNEATNIICRITHAHSGQWMEGSLIVESNIRDAKTIGSALSYGQRYLIRGLLGLPVADDLDDDGTEASKEKKEKRPSYNEQPEREQAPPTGPIVEFEITNELELQMVNATSLDELRDIYNGLPTIGKNDKRVIAMKDRHKARLLSEAKKGGGNG